jgi:hypothetical protein
VPITALPAPANTHDHVLLSATLDVLTDLLTEVGAAAERTTVHLDGRTPSQPVVPNACARCFLATALTAGCTCFSAAIREPDSSAGDPSGCALDTSCRGVVADRHAGYDHRPDASVTRATGSQGRFVPAGGRSGGDRPAGAGQPGDQRTV